MTTIAIKKVNQAPVIPEYNPPVMYELYDIVDMESEKGTIVKVKKLRTVVNKQMLENQIMNLQAQIDVIQKDLDAIVAIDLEETQG